MVKRNEDQEEEEEKQDVGDRESSAGDGNAGDGTAQERTAEARDATEGLEGNKKREVQPDINEFWFPSDNEGDIDGSDVEEGDIEEAAQDENLDL